MGDLINLDDHRPPVPPPGSNEAILMGCLCPAMDNAHGKGVGDGKYWINVTCPIHVIRRPVPSPPNIQIKESIDLILIVKGTLIGAILGVFFLWLNS
ncbi:MAG: hypothetical protein ACE5KG_06035 [Nitrososphaerales archaeon]